MALTVSLPRAGGFGSCVVVVLNPLINYTYFLPCSSCHRRSGPIPHFSRLKTHTFPTSIIIGTDQRFVNALWRDCTERLDIGHHRTTADSTSKATA